MERIPRALKAVANARSVTLPDGRNFSSRGETAQVHRWGSRERAMRSQRCSCWLPRLAYSARGAWAQQTQRSIPRSADGKLTSPESETLSAAEYDLESHSTRKDAPPGPGIVEGAGHPHRPEVSQQRKKNFDARATSDPRTGSPSPSAPRAASAPNCSEFFSGTTRSYAGLPVRHSVRTIHTNETRHPRRPDLFWLGWNSRARWRGHARRRCRGLQRRDLARFRAGVSTATNCTSSSVNFFHATRFSTPRRSDDPRMCTRGPGAGALTRYRTANPTFS